MDQLGPDMETKLGQLLRHLRVQRAGLGGVGQAGLDRRQRGAVHDGLGELLEQQGFQGGLRAEVERPRLFQARNRRRPGAAERDDFMSPSQGGEADLAT